VVSRLKSQSGQALVEYILLLIITVGLILGLSRQFFMPAQKYANFFMGTYIKDCVLDYGTLPAFAVGPDSKNTNSACTAMLSASGFKDGPGANGSSGSNSDNSSASNGKSATPAANTSQGKNNSAQNTANRANASGGKPGSRTGGSRAGLGASGEDLGPGGADGASSANRRSLVRSKNKGPDLKPVSAQAGNSYEGSRTAVRVHGFAGNLVNEKAAPTIVEEKLSKEYQDETTVLKPKKISIKAAERSIAKASDDDVNFSFGNLIRILIIVIIIGAIVYVVSTQVSSVTKGMEK
jgi:hypothetical protein